ncbi:hypothetical protein D6745_02535, partial [Candidatus Woesearchaeota archaeon]
SKADLDEFSKEELKIIVLELKKRYGVKDSEIKEITREKDNLIPITAFAGNLSPLEAAAYYLNTEKGISVSSIANILKRKQPTIWTAVKNAEKKNPPKPRECMISIGAELLADPKLSILEVVVHYLKREYNISFAQIASLLNKDQRTIWTAYNRGVRKRR